MRGRPWWIWVLVVLAIGVAKAHLHMMRLLILAAAGLAGLYLLHLLAQDYQKIRPQLNRNGAIQRFTSMLRSSGIGKRSTSDWLSERLANETQEMKEVLRNDPIGCARKFVCHISKYSKEKLTGTQNNILALLRVFAWLDSGGEWKKAEELGKKDGNKGACEKKYNRCFYTGVQLEHFVNVL